MHFTWMENIGSNFYFIYLFIHLYIHLFIYLFIHLFVYLFICLQLTMIKKILYTKLHIKQTAAD